MEVQSNEHGGIKGIGVIEEMNFDGAYFFELFWSDTIKLFWPVRPLSTIEMEKCIKRRIFFLEKCK